VSDYHFFKEGIRPVWEDDENKRGGKWIMRLKKGVADRYWEELLMALIGDQFVEAADEVCGFVLSVRSGEDVFSIWTKNDGGRNIKIRLVDCYPKGDYLLILSQRDGQARPEPAGGHHYHLAQSR
jgi:translation initiation factor 4E